MREDRGTIVIGRVVAALLVALAGTAAAGRPFIVGSSAASRCRVALAMARSAFDSASFSLDWPIPAPPAPSRIVLRQREADISGGDGIEADSAAFLTRHQPHGKDYSATIFWSRNAYAGKRLVVVDRPFNWRGDWYTVYLLASDETPQRFGKQLTAQEANRPNELKPLLGDNRWNPPTVLTGGARGGYWIIDRGEPYDVMPDWRVFVPTAAGARSPCRISFGADGRAGLGHLPPAVRKLAAELDEALGPGTGEGTLQPTAAIRITVAQAWANAAIRPWALTTQPYNSRNEVERGLAYWARASRTRTALLTRIKQDYPAAERALASYYASHRIRTLSTPQASASRVLDTLFRTYFVFPKSSAP